DRNIRRRAREARVSMGGPGRGGKLGREILPAPAAARHRPGPNLHTRGRTRPGARGTARTPALVAPAAGPAAPPPPPAPPPPAPPAAPDPAPGRPRPRPAPLAPPPRAENWPHLDCV